jgi:aspartate kinase
MQVKLNVISYREATELAYFGAKIIHPKTARPLMLSKIFLCTFVLSKNPSEVGTSVQNVAEPINPLVPIYILYPKSGACYNLQ